MNGLVLTAGVSSSRNYQLVDNITPLAKLFQTNIIQGLQKIYFLIFIMHARIRSESVVKVRRNAWEFSIPFAMINLYISKLEVRAA